MNYSFMTFSCPELSLEEVIGLALKFGYNSIEPRIGSGHKHGVEIEASPEKRQKIKAVAEKSGISFSCLATSCVFADPAKKAGSIEFALKAVDLASDIGCERLRVFGGVIPEGISREQAVDDVAAALSEIAPRAEEKNVAVCIETHDDWSNPDYVAAVLRKVSSSAIAVNWDIMHPVRAAGKSIDEAFNTLKPWIKHCHIHDGVWEGEDKKLTLKPIGTGMVDHKRALELLSGIDYKSALSGEWINWADFPAEKHLPCEIATLKKYEKEISGKGR